MMAWIHPIWTQAHYHQPNWVSWEQNGNKAHHCSLIRTQNLVLSFPLQKPPVCEGETCLSACLSALGGAGVLLSCRGSRLVEVSVTHGGIMCLELLTLRPSWLQLQCRCSSNSISCYDKCDSSFESQCPNIFIERSCCVFFGLD